MFPQHIRSGLVPFSRIRRCCVPVGAMDVRAIILAGLLEETSEAPAESSFSGVPFSLLPVLGRPLLHRIADRLKDAGVDSISVLNAADSGLPLVQEAHRADLNWKDVASEQMWRAAEERFDELVQSGAETVVVMRLGAYAEVEIDPLLQFHLDKRNHVTQVVAPGGPLDVFVLSASRRNDAAFLFRNKLAKSRVSAPPFVTTGYTNSLRNAGDLRRLVQDAFALKTAIQPAGKEVRPGIWVANGAKIHRSVRMVAPCYIGAFSKIRAGALITRGSAIEHHAIVDCGSVVEASTLLPLSALGAGLDLTYSVVGSKRVASVKYGAELEVEDETLLSSVPSTSVLRTLSHAAGLLAFVPRQVVRGFSGSKARKTQVEAECPSGSFDPAAVTHSVGQDRPALTSGVVARARE